MLHRALTIVSEKPSPNRIPLSDPAKLKARDYYSAFFHQPNSAGQFLFRGLLEGGFANGLWWENGNADPVDRNLSLAELSTFQPDYTQYKAELEIRYTSTREFVVQQTLLIPAFRLARVRVQHWVWGKRTLVRNDRMDVLQHMVGRLDDEDDEYVSAERLMTELYGASWWYTKRALKDHSYYRLLLASMVASGDVEHRGGYKATPQALRTLSDFELEDRRHREAALLQKAIVALTVILAMIGMLQASVAALAYFKPIASASSPLEPPVPAH